MTNLILHCEGTLSGKAQIWPSTSQKNANSQRHLLLLSGLRQLGGAHTRGLRIGKDGIRTAGRMRSKDGVKPVSNGHRQEPKDLTANLIDFFVFVPRIHFLGRATARFLFCVASRTSAILRTAHGLRCVNVIHSFPQSSCSAICLLNVPYRPFFCVLFSPSAPSSIPSASTTPITRSRCSVPSAPARWSKSGRVANPSPNVGYEPNIGNFSSHGSGAHADRDP